MDQRELRQASAERLLDPELARLQQELDDLKAAICKTPASRALLRFVTWLSGQRLVLWLDRVLPPRR